MPETEKNINDYTIFDLIAMSPDDAGKVLVDECKKEYPNIELIQNILEFSPVNVNVQYSNGRTTALIVASANGRTEIARMLLERPEILVNLQDEDGETALMRASANVRTEIVKLLLERPEIDVNLQDEDGETALMRASNNGRTEIVKLLLERPEIDVNLENQRYQTAFMLASKEGETKVANLLKEHSKSKKPKKAKVS